MCCLLLKDEYSTFGEHVGNQLRSLNDKHDASIAQIKIYEILYKASIGEYRHAQLDSNILTLMKLNKLNEPSSYFVRNELNIKDQIQPIDKTQEIGFSQEKLKQLESLDGTTKLDIASNGQNMLCIKEEEMEPLFMEPESIPEEDDHKLKQDIKEEEMNATFDDSESILENSMVKEENPIDVTLSVSFNWPKFQANNEKNSQNVIENLNLENNRYEDSISQTIVDKTLLPDNNTKTTEDKAIRQKGHKCLQCNQIFDRKCNLNRHYMAVHEKLKPFNCSICDRAFSEKNKVLVHMMLVHEKIRLGHHKCPKCDKVFDSKCNLSRHCMSVHEKLKPFICNICKTAFSEKSKLTFHVKSVHDKVKPFQCTDCESAFSLKGSLVDHIQSVHEQIKPYKCLHCDQAFYRRRYLTKHCLNFHNKFEERVE